MSAILIGKKFSLVMTGLTEQEGAPTLGGRQHTILSNFPKNCMESRKFWAVEGERVPGAPPWIRHCRCLQIQMVHLRMRSAAYAPLPPQCTDTSTQCDNASK